MIEIVVFCIGAICVIGALFFSENTWKNTQHKNDDNYENNYMQELYFDIE